MKLFACAAERAYFSSSGWVGPVSTRLTNCQQILARYHIRKVKLHLKHNNVVSECRHTLRRQEQLLGLLSNPDLEATRLTAGRQVNRQGQGSPRKFDRGEVRIRFRPSQDRSVS